MVGIVIPRRSILKLGCAVGVVAAASYARRLDWAMVQKAEAMSDAGQSCTYRDITRQAYGLKSWINQPIGLGATYGLSTVFGNSSTDADVAFLQSTIATNSYVHSGDNNAQMWLTSTASDPLVTWHDRSSSSSPDYAGNANLVHVPASMMIGGVLKPMTPYAGTQHLSIMDTAQGIVAHGYECQFSASQTGTTDYGYGWPAPTVSTGGRMQFNLGRYDDLYGDGISPCTAPGITSTRENRYGWGNCTLRVEDIVDFYGVNNQRMDSIRHVLRYVLSYMYMQGYNDPSPNDQGWNWPEIALDYCYNKTSASTGAYYTNISECTPGSGQYTGAPLPSISAGNSIAPALFLAIPTVYAGGPDITTITTPNGALLTPEALAIAWTLQNYGAAWRDSTGNHSNGPPPVGQMAIDCDPRLIAAGANSSSPEYSGSPNTALPARAAYSSLTNQFYSRLLYAIPTLVKYLTVVRNYSNGSDGLVPFAGGNGFVTNSIPAKYSAADNI